jgi:hypothetical protein
MPVLGRFRLWRQRLARFPVAAQERDTIARPATLLCAGAGTYGGGVPDRRANRGSRRSNRRRRRSQAPRLIAASVAWASVLTLEFAPLRFARSRRCASRRRRSSEACRCTKRPVRIGAPTLGLSIHRKAPATRRCLFIEHEVRAWLDGAQLETIDLEEGGRVVRIATD